MRNICIDCTQESDWLLEGRCIHCHAAHQDKEIKKLRAVCDELSGALQKIADGFETIGGFTARISTYVQAKEIANYALAKYKAMKSTVPRLSEVKYGCHCDLEPGQQPDGCVLDYNAPGDCIYAKDGMRREQCEYWRVITTNED